MMKNHIHSRQITGRSLLLVSALAMFASTSVPAQPEVSDKDIDSERQPPSKHSDVLAEDTSPDSSPVLTSSEKGEQLDQTLDDRFAEFDRLLLRERENLSKEQNEQGSSSVGSSFGNEDKGDGVAGNEPEDENQNQTSTTATNEEGRPQENGLPGENAQASIPPDLQDGSNDDVIARQLREAALKEKDPVLQKKLWDEYRKYKQGT